MEMDLGISFSRRLPVYLVLDTSRSMRGEPIKMVNDGIRLLKDSLLNNPAAIEVAYLGVITFATEAQQIVPLTALTEFSPPELVAGGWSAMGAALTLLGEVLGREIIPNAPECKGDYRPIVFLMTDGRPSDGWKRAIKTLRERARIGVFVALGCGPGADLEVLAAIADVALSMQEVTPEKMNGFFKWISQSIGTASRTSSTPASRTVDLPPLPPFISRIGM